MELVLLLIVGFIVFSIFDAISNFFGKSPTVFKEIKESTKEEIKSHRNQNEIKAQIERTKLINELAQTRSRLPKEVLEQMHKMGEIDSLELVTALNIKEQNERYFQPRHITPDFDFPDFEDYKSNVRTNSTHTIESEQPQLEAISTPKIENSQPRVLFENTINPHQIKYKFCTRCGGRGMVKYRHIENGKCFECGRIPNRYGSIIR